MLVRQQRLDVLHLCDMYVTSILIMFLTDHVSNYICNLRMDINAFAPDASGGQEGLGSIQVYKSTWALIPPV